MNHTHSKFNMSDHIFLGGERVSYEKIGDNGGGGGSHVKWCLLEVIQENVPLYMNS